MATVVLVIHLMLAAALIGVVLLQRSEGGALGIGGGGGGGGGGFLTGRGTANLLTRATAVLAAGFFTTSIVLTLLAQKSAAPRSVFDQLNATAPRAAWPPDASSAARDHSTRPGPTAAPARSPPAHESALARCRKTQCRPVAGPMNSRCSRPLLRLKGMIGLREVIHRRTCRCDHVAPRVVSAGLRQIETPAGAGNELP